MHGVCLHTLYAGICLYPEHSCVHIHLYIYALIYKHAYKCTDLSHISNTACIPLPISFPEKKPMSMG